MTTLYLLRHGQASFGADDYDALSPRGEEQSRRVGAALRARGLKPDVVISGSMRRHRETAALCLAELDNPPEPVVDAAWNEYDHVALLVALDPRYAQAAAVTADLAKSTDPHRDFQRLFARAAQRWVRGENDADYAESWRAFCARVESALAGAIPQVGAERTGLVVTSGGVISVICRKLLQLREDAALALAWTLANAAITKLILGSAGWRLASLNEQGHFEGEHANLLTYR